MKATGREWSTAEIEGFKMDFNAGLTYLELAEKYDLRHAQVSNLIQKLRQTGHTMQHRSHRQRALSCRSEKKPSPRPGIRYVHPNGVTSRTWGDPAYIKRLTLDLKQSGLTVHPL